MKLYIFENLRTGEVFQRLLSVTSKAFFLKYYPNIKLIRSPMDLNMTDLKRWKEDEESLFSGTAPPVTKDDAERGSW